MGEVFDLSHSRHTYRLSDVVGDQVSSHAARTSLWLHSRDMPGYAASHGCVGLYDEEMEQKFFHYPSDPQLMDSKRLYLWVFPARTPTRPASIPKDWTVSLSE